MELAIFKKDNMAAIYRNVDAIIKKNETDYGTIPNGVKKDAALAAMSKLHKRRYFDICTVNNIYELFNVHMTSERRSFFGVIHCVDWADIPKDTREYVTAIIFEDLRSVFYAEENYIEAVV